MVAQLRAIVQPKGEWWIGWVEELPGANAQERSKTELLESLREAANDILELNREDARSMAQEQFEEVAL